MCAAMDSAHMVAWFLCKKFPPRWREISWQIPLDTPGGYSLQNSCWQVHPDPTPSYPLPPQQGGVIYHILRFQKMDTLLPIGDIVYEFSSKKSANFAARQACALFSKITGTIQLTILHKKNNRSKENLKYFRPPKWSTWFLTWTKGKYKKMSSFSQL